MAQPILKRRLNPLLLISTVAALSLLAGVSVLYQDQISQSGEELNQIQNEKTELNNTVRRLEAEKQNQSVEINRLQDRVETLNTEKDSLNDTIQQKNQEISNLESRLQEVREEAKNSDQVDSINQSLATVCALGETWKLEDRAREDCQEWGHQIGSNDES